MVLASEPVDGRSHVTDKREILFILVMCYTLSYYRGCLQLRNLGRNLGTQMMHPKFALPTLLACLCVYLSMISQRLTITSIHIKHFLEDNNDII